MEVSRTCSADVVSLSHLSDKKSFDQKTYVTLDKDEITEGQSAQIFAAYKRGAARRSSEQMPMICNSSMVPNKRVERASERPFSDWDADLSVTASLEDVDFKPQVPPLKERLGNGWLKDRVEEIRRVDRSAHWSTDDDLVFEIIREECKKREDHLFDHLEALFPERRVTREEVAGISLEELQNFSAVDFFAIIDLIDANHALKLLELRLDTDRKMGIYFINQEMAVAFGRIQQDLFDKPVTQKIRAQADLALTVLPRYTTEAMFESSHYERLDQERMKCSLSCVQEKHTKRKWELANQKCFKRDLSRPLGVEFLVNLNEYVKAPSDAKDREHLRLRHGGEEIFSGGEDDLFYLPGREVESATERLLVWINRKVEECDRGEANPIIVAALAYQRFVSIHPFLDGNGRTGRILADMILRRYQILPVAWVHENVSLFVIDRAGVSKTPDEVVQQILAGLECSYKIYEGSADTSESKDDSLH